MVGEFAVQQILNGQFFKAIIRFYDVCYKFDIYYWTTNDTLLLV